MLSDVLLVHNLHPRSLTFKRLYKRFKVKPHSHLSLSDPAYLLGSERDRNNNDLTGAFRMFYLSRAKELEVGLPSTVGIPMSTDKNETRERKAMLREVRELNQICSGLTSEEVSRRDELFIPYEVLLRHYLIKTALEEHASGSPVKAAAPEEKINSSIRMLYLNLVCCR